MLVDPRVEKMAQVLVHYSLGVQPGMQVCINSTTLAAPLIGAVYREVLVAGGHPTTHLSLPGLTEELLAHAVSLLTENADSSVVGTVYTQYALLELQRDRLAQAAADNELPDADRRSVAVARNPQQHVRVVRQDRPR